MENLMPFKKNGEITGKPLFSFDEGRCKQWYDTEEQALRCYTVKFGRVPVATPVEDPEATMLAMLGVPKEKTPEEIMNEMLGL